MRTLFGKARLNLGLKRVFVYHPVSSKVLTLFAPRRLRLPRVDFVSFVGRPAPVIAHLYSSAPRMNTDALDLVPLCSLAAAIDAKRILEVGCSWGSGSLNLALACPAARIVTYDINPDAGDFIRKAPADIRDRVEIRIANFPTDAARLEADPLYDFIFIDGNHTAPCVRADTELALRRLAPGGIIAWHDYHHWGHEWVDGSNLVPEVLNELATRLPLRHLDGCNLAVWRKPSA